MFRPSSYAPDQALRNYALAIYALQAASYFTVISYFIAPALAYWKRKEAQGTWLESHLRWQINTFWFSLGGIVLGLLTLYLEWGVFILIINSLWFVYRIGQGWTRLSRGQAIGSVGAGLS
jgi:uncharacterized membrane protein